MTEQEEARRFALGTAYCAGILLRIVNAEQLRVALTVGREQNTEMADFATKLLEEEVERRCLSG